MSKTTNYGLTQCHARLRTPASGITDPGRPAMPPSSSELLCVWVV